MEIPNKEHMCSKKQRDSEPHKSNVLIFCLMSHEFRVFLASYGVSEIEQSIAISL